MSFTDEQKAELQQLLAEGLSGIKDELLSGVDTRISASVSGLASKLQRDTVPKVVNKTLETYLDSLIEDELGAGESSSSSSSSSISNPAQPAPPLSSPQNSPESDELKQQIAKLSAEMQATQKRLQEEQNKRVSMEQEQRKAAMRQSVIKQLAGDNPTAPNVVNPEDLFFLLERHGVLTEKDDQYLLNTGQVDSFGEPVYRSPKEALPDLLKDPRYALYVPPRPGTGTGGGSVNSKPASLSGQYYNGESLPDTQTLVDAMQDPTKMQIVLAEAEKLLS